jgi:hypothetical protein
MYNKKAWIKELKSWIRNSKSYKRYAEKQIEFWQKLHKDITKQLALEEEWLREAEEK